MKVAVHLLIAEAPSARPSLLVPEEGVLFVLLFLPRTMGALGS